MDGILDYVFYVYREDVPLDYLLLSLTIFMTITAANLATLFFWRQFQGGALMELLEKYIWNPYFGLVLGLSLSIYFLAVQRFGLLHVPVAIVVSIASELIFPKLLKVLKV
ncbi:hypothetical protein H6G00_01960 [Leptolyngbya sp. FACHB-541]|uniref:hypothetical protein n=1 Tax=Leptolyngbya sp. FACHB-541 TaxID=2692810 RepID=UPI001686394E|nr:hypothetical protein [Leptolyngbya sp. FACHB-541]MBD1995397.1 hypothetical protein [Leptolyngbya sp. FACHB-541]